VVMRSPHLALGYWHDDELTASRFRPDPHGSGPRDQLYVTGDLGRYRVDGSVEFLGRKDQQVQQRGFRIELGENAAHLRRASGVADAAVDLSDHGTGSSRLIAYVVPSAGTHIDAGAVRRSMRDALPAHMVPAEVVELERIPLTPNGKLDRRALPALTDPAAAVHPPTAVPTDSLQRELHEIWCEALGSTDIGVTDDFFEVGGHSLLATRVLAMIEDRLGAQMSVSVFFEHPTIVGLAAHISDPAVRDRVHPSRTRIERRDPAEPPVLSFAQERMWFLQQFETDTTPLVVRTIVAMHGQLDLGALRRGLDEIYSRQIEALGRKGDVLVVFSTSGNSSNILNALAAARKCGMVTVAMLGKSGGKAAGRADHEIIIASQDGARVQEAHTLILHLWLELIEAALE
ncbi:MAG: phosphopantetheine-binding protein, partial [Actinomycetota bacterium]|nr:phosphopantetheine-binding protein [Actinomycetota bacterium]